MLKPSVKCSASNTGLFDGGNVENQIIRFRISPPHPAMREQNPNVSARPESAEREHPHEVDEPDRQVLHDRRQWPVRVVVDVALGG